MTVSKIISFPWFSKAKYLLSNYSIPAGMAEKIVALHKMGYKFSEEFVGVCRNCENKIGREAYELMTRASEYEKYQKKGSKELSLTIGGVMVENKVFNLSNAEVKAEAGRPEVIVAPPLTRGEVAEKLSAEPLADQPAPQASKPRITEQLRSAARADQIEGLERLEKVPVGIITPEAIDAAINLLSGGKLRLLEIDHLRNWLGSVERNRSASFKVREAIRKALNIEKKLTFYEQPILVDRKRSPEEEPEIAKLRTALGKIQEDSGQKAGEIIKALNAKGITAFDLSGYNLTGIAWAGLDLNGSDFSGADLRGASLSGSNLNYVRFNEETLFANTRIDIKAFTLGVWPIERIDAWSSYKVMPDGIIWTGEGYYNGPSEEAGKYRKHFSGIL